MSSPPAPTTTVTTTLDDTKHLACSTFLAGDENVRIIPSFTYDGPIELMSRASIGPLKAGMDTVVPLWCAILLRQRNMGRILPPDWMDVTLLKRVLAHEKDPTVAVFSSELPLRYQEMARSILAVESDIEHAAQIRLLLEDIGTVRIDKIKSNMHQLSQQALSQPTTLPIIDVSNIGSLELAAYRPFITKAFREHLELTRKTVVKKGNLSTEETRGEAMRAAGKSEQLDEEEDEEEDEAPRVRSRIRRFR